MSATVWGVHVERNRQSLGLRRETAELLVAPGRE